MKQIVIAIAALLFTTVTASAQLPKVLLKDISGRAVSTDTLSNNGKPFIIDFFATWCKPCMRELEALNELYPDWQDQTGVQIYIVSIDQAQDVQKVRPLVDGKGWDFHVLLDPNGTLKRAMNVQNVPHLFVLDSHGNIVYNHTGYADGDEKQLRKYLK